MTPDQLSEAAQDWFVRRVDSQRWEITDGNGGWAPMPRVIAHAMLNDQDVRFSARFAPRRVAEEALSAFRRGERAPLYRVTGQGLEKVLLNGSEGS